MIVRAPLLLKVPDSYNELKLEVKDNNVIDSNVFSISMDKPTSVKYVLIDAFMYI